MRLRALAAAVALLAAPPHAWAAVVRTVSAQQLEGNVTGLTGDGRLELESGGRKSFLALAEVHRILLQDRIPAREAASVAEVRTVDGSRMYGSLVQSTRAVAVLSRAVGQAVHLDAPRLLGIKLERKETQEFTADQFAQALARRNRDGDELFVASPKGIVPFTVAIDKIGPDKTTFTWERQNRVIDTAKVAAVVFANSMADEVPPAAVVLVDASVLRGRLLALDTGKVVLELLGTKVSVPAASVVEVELVNPNIAYLSMLEPVEVQETPFFNHIWKHRNDQSATGGPLSLDGRKYAHGIGCHTRTALTYDLGGRYKKFAAEAGIDDAARPRGSVDFIVEADGKPVFSKRLTGRDKAVALAIDIEGVRKLCLVTDFAEDASVGDHADWADARVMK